MYAIRRCNICNTFILEPILKILNIRTRLKASDVTLCTEMCIILHGPLDASNKNDSTLSIHVFKCFNKYIVQDLLMGFFSATG